MISRTTIYFFLCVFVQQQSCTPVPTNTKIRHDVRRSSIQDDATTPTTSSSSSTSSSRPTSVSASSTPSSDLSTARSEPTPLLATGSPNGSSTTDFIKLSDIFEEPAESNGKLKTKRDAPIRAVDEHEAGDPLSFKPEHADQEDDMEVAETHLFRPLFKYKSVNSERRHIRQPNVTSTTTK